MDKDNLLQKWINTPFAYTRYHHDLSLLQQDVLIRVSERLQRFMQEYHGSELKDSKAVPKSMFADAVRKAGISEFHITFAELGVAPNNYPAVKKAVDEVLDIKFEHMIEEDGVPKMVRFPIFNKSKIPLTDDNSSVTFSLNIDVVEEARETRVVDYVFDMSQGYVTHPENIARISSFERMPMIYYLLKHESQNWKKKQIGLTVTQIKEYMKMIKRDDNGRIISISYPKFSKFRDRVLIPAIQNINELHEHGPIEVSVQMDFRYPGTRHTGDPELIIFSFDAKGRNEKAQPSVAVQPAVVTDAPKRRGRPRKNMPASQRSIQFEDLSYIEVFPKDGVGEEPDYEAQILSALRSTFGNGQQGYDYYFGKRARASVCDDHTQVVLAVPASVKDSVKSSPMVMEKIHRSVVEVLGHDAEVLVVPIT